MQVGVENSFPVQKPSLSFDKWRLQRQIPPVSVPWELTEAAFFPFVSSKYL